MRTLALTFMGGLVLAGLQPAVAQDVAAGAAVYGRECGRCHAPRAAVEFSDREWHVIMQHMRVIAEMPTRQTREVLAFLQASNGANTAEAAAQAPAAEPAAGSADAPGTIAQMGCLGCHAIAGNGGNLGPSLDGVGARRSAEYLSRKLQNPRFDNPQSIMPAAGLSDAQRTRIVEYLTTLR
jgi:mono/diheme cytochrome c family protein